MSKKGEKIHKRIQKISDKQNKILARKQEKAERKKAKEVGLPDVEDFKVYNPVHRKKALEMLKAGQEQRSKTYKKNVIVKFLEKKKDRLITKKSKAYRKDFNKSKSSHEMENGGYVYPTTDARKRSK